MQGQLAAHQLGFDEVVVQGKLLATQWAILVHVGWLPDLPQHRVGQLGPHHLLLSTDWVQRVEDLVVGGLVLAHHPFDIVDALAGPVAIADPKGACSWCWGRFRSSQPGPASGTPPGAPSPSARGCPWP